MGAPGALESGRFADCPRDVGQAREEARRSADRNRSRPAVRPADEDEGGELVNVEADRIANSLNTLREQIMRWIRVRNRGRRPIIAETKEVRN